MNVLQLNPGWRRRALGGALAAGLAVAALGAALPARMARAADAPLALTVTNAGDEGGAANCPGANCTLRAAIDAVDAATQGLDNTIKISVQGPIKLVNGPLLINNKVAIDGSGVEIDGGTASVVLNFNSDNNDFDTLSNLTVTGGRQGIHTLASNLTFSNVTVQKATANGGIESVGGSLDFKGQNSVVDNTGGAFGGISSGGALTINNQTDGLTRIQRNHSGGNGGGILFDSGFHTTGVFISEAIISDNTARGSGGGIWSAPAAGTIIGSTTISGNKAGTGGGGIFASPAIAPQAAKSKSDTQGTPDLALTNVTLAANDGGTGVGGAVEVVGGAKTWFSYDTVAGNSAATGGGIGVVSGTAIFHNTILANQASDAQTANCSGAVTSDTHNLTFGGECDSKPGDFVGQDPKLGPLAFNDGPLKDKGALTMTMALQPGSPAIDKAEEQSADNAFSLVKSDQRGITRGGGVDSSPGTGDGPDIGAFEATSGSNGTSGGGGGQPGNGNLPAPPSTGTGPA